MKCTQCGKEFIKQINKVSAPSMVVYTCKHLTKADLVNLEQTEWAKEKHYCKICGKLMTEKYGSGVFCSKACANTREHSDETKLKLSNAAKGKVAYWDENKKIKYFFPQEQVPDNYIKTYCKRTTALKQKTNSTSIQRYSFNALLEQALPDITKHNNKVLAEYQNLLSMLSQNKTFNIDNQFIFAKYYSVQQEHPRGHEGHVFVHILLAEALLGRPLNKFEIVHHKDLNKLNNTFDNIYIFDTLASHARFHQSPYYWLEITPENTLTCNKITKQFLIDFLKENKERH